MPRAERGSTVPKSTVLEWVTTQTFQVESTEVDLVFVARQLIGGCAHREG